MNYSEDVCVPVEDIIARLKGKIKLEFEVERMEPLFENQFAYDDSQSVTALIMLKLLISHLTRATAISESSMRVQQQPRLL